MSWGEPKGAQWVAADEFEAMERRAQAAEADWENAVQEADRLRAEVERLAVERIHYRDAIDQVLHELGVPGPEYPAPVVNAVTILEDALR